MSEHYTIVTIKSPTKNSPAQKSLEKIKTELASIYRQSLRDDEMDLFISGDALSFDNIRRWMLRLQERQMGESFIGRKILISNLASIEQKDLLLFFAK